MDHIQYYHPLSQCLKGDISQQHLLFPPTMYWGSTGNPAHVWTAPCSTTKSPLLVSKGFGAFLCSPRGLQVTGLQILNSTSCFYGKCRNPIAGGKTLDPWLILLSRAVQCIFVSSLENRSLPPKSICIVSSVLHFQMSLIWAKRSCLNTP